MLDFVALRVSDIARATSTNAREGEAPAAQLRSVDSCCGIDMLNGQCDFPFLFQTFWCLNLGIDRLLRLPREIAGATSTSAYIWTICRRCRSRGRGIVSHFYRLSREIV